MEKDITARVRAKYDKKANSYDKLLGPMEKMMMGKWRRELCQKAQGLVLEAGVGTGANIPYYPEGIHVIAVDFSPEMLKMAEKKLVATKAIIDLQLADIQDLPFESNYFDTVITTCVFCSVPDAVKGFQELQRVTKPGGKLYLLEHVRSEGVVLGSLMDWVNPISFKLSGVNINRRTEQNIELAGLKVTKVDYLFGDIVRLITAVPNKC